MSAFEQSALGLARTAAKPGADFSEKGTEEAFDHVIISIVTGMRNLGWLTANRRPRLVKMVLQTGAHNFVSQAYPASPKAIDIVHWRRVRAATRSRNGDMTLFLEPTACTPVTIARTRPRSQKQTYRPSDVTFAPAPPHPHWHRSRRLTTAQANDLRAVRTRQQHGRMRVSDDAIWRQRDRHDNIGTGCRFNSGYALKP